MCQGRCCVRKLCQPDGGACRSGKWSRYKPERLGRELEEGATMSLFNVGFVIFPDLTQLDFTGPQQVLARLPDSAMHIVAKNKEPVPSDSGLSLMPTHTLRTVRTSI